jgi:hypothetical protein
MSNPILTTGLFFTLTVSAGVQTSHQSSPQTAPEIGYKWGEFFLKYQGRIMFGTDNGMDEEMYRNHFCWLETTDEYFDYWGYPGQGHWKIYGMELPDPVLEKIYHLNAERIFRQFNGAAVLQRGAK